MRRWLCCLFCSSSNRCYLSCHIRRSCHFRFCVFDTFAYSGSIHVGLAIPASYAQRIHPGTRTRTSGLVCSLPSGQFHNPRWHWQAFRHRRWHLRLLASYCTRKWCSNIGCRFIRCYGCCRHCVRHAISGKGLALDDVMKPSILQTILVIRSDLLVWHICTLFHSYLA